MNCYYYVYFSLTVILTLLFIKWHEYAELSKFWASENVMKYFHTIFYYIHLTDYSFALFTFLSFLFFYIFIWWLPVIISCEFNYYLFIVTLILFYLTFGGFYITTHSGRYLYDIEWTAIMTNNNKVSNPEDKLSCDEKKQKNQNN